MVKLTNISSYTIIQRSTPLPSMELISLFKAVLIDTWRRWSNSSAVDFVVSVHWVEWERHRPFSLSSTCPPHHVSIVPCGTIASLSDCPAVGQGSQGSAQRLGSSRGSPNIQRVGGGASEEGEYWCQMRAHGNFVRTVINTICIY